MKKLQVGSGPIYLDGWVNIDISDKYKTDICADVLTLDFKDVNAIYSCHAFEHFSYPDGAVKFLELSYKWLREGGILRLAVPNLSLAAYGYVNGSNLKFLYGESFKGYYHRDTPAERFNFFVKEWKHTMCYDFNLLSLLMSEAGFRNIRETQANESAIPDFDSDRFISESLYIEAVK